MNNGLFQKTKVEFHDWPNFMQKIITCIYLAKIHNNLIPHPLKSTFRKEGRSIMCPSVTIRPTIDYPKMADICFAAVWSRDKFPGKINKLTRDHIDLWTKMATVGSTCLQQDITNPSDLNHIIFAHKGQSDIDEGKWWIYEYFSSMANLVSSQIASYREISSERHIYKIWWNYINFF